VPPGADAPLRSRPAATESISIMIMSVFLAKMRYFEPPFIIR